MIHRARIYTIRDVRWRDWVGGLRGNCANHKTAEVVEIETAKNQKWCCASERAKLKSVSKDEIFASTPSQSTLSLLKEFVFTAYIQTLWCITFFDCRRQWSLFDRVNSQFLILLWIWCSRDWKNVHVHLTFPYINLLGTFLLCVYVCIRFPNIYVFILLFNNARRTVRAVVTFLKDWSDGAYCFSIEGVIARWRCGLMRWYTCVDVV